MSFVLAENEHVLSFYAPSKYEGKVWVPGWCEVTSGGTLTPIKIDLGGLLRWEVYAEILLQRMLEETKPLVWLVRPRLFREGIFFREHLTYKRSKQLQAMFDQIREMVLDKKHSVESVIKWTNHYRAWMAGVDAIRHEFGQEIV